MNNKIIHSTYGQQMLIMGHMLGSIMPIKSFDQDLPTHNSPLRIPKIVLDEYELIKQKKSNLSRSKRDAIVKRVEEFMLKSETNE